MGNLILFNWGVLAGLISTLSLVFFLKRRGLNLEDFDRQQAFQDIIEEAAQSNVQFHNRYQELRTAVEELRAAQNRLGGDIEEAAKQVDTVLGK